MFYDFYWDLSHLKSVEEPTAWVQEIKNRGSKTTIVAPHGGAIEFLTDALARDIAGQDFNLFTFVGRDKKLHITSHNFRDPDLEKLQRISKLTLSVHGIPYNWGTTLVGGLNHKKRNRVIKYLRVYGFNAEIATHPFAGTHPGNFVNLTPKRGVQLELSLDQREKLKRSPARYNDFVEAVRLALGGENEG